MESLVLIFNPLNSKLGEDLAALLKNEPGLTYFYLHDFDSIDNVCPNVQPDIIFFLLDTCCSSINIKIVEKFKSHFRMVPVIGVFDSNKICIDCELLKKIIWNFIPIHAKKEDILLTINWFNQQRNKLIQSSLKKHAMFDLYKGNSKVSIEIKEKILKIAGYDVTVLINGETGTGKELCAKMIHFLSSRSKNNFVPLNCGAVPVDLFENELFGHKKGAYTNADSTENGLIAEANNGTLFLDEIESLPELMQVKLLRFLEDKKYKPLGQANYISSNVRVIAAAKENLWERVKKHLFREDLYFRLNIVDINLPPLRERKEDIPLLVEFFISRFSKMYGKSIEGIKPLAMMAMFHHNWEGNIRELENIVQQAIIMNVSGWIEEEDLGISKRTKSKMIFTSSFNLTKKMIVSDFEKSYLNNLMMMFKGNLTQSAKFAGKDRRAFSRMLKKYNIDPSVYKNN